MTKPHLILTPINEICVLDVIVFNGRLRVIDKMRRGCLTTYVRFHNGDSVWLNNGEKFYAETALQTYARSPRGRELLGANAGVKQVPSNPPCSQCKPKLDDGQCRAVAATRDKCAASEHTDNLQGVQQPRATVRMTLGRDIKPGDRISCVVAHDQACKANYFHSGPFGARVLIEPHLYYQVVNDVTK